MSERDIRQEFEKAGQSHVFTFWDRLTEHERKSLLAQLEDLDVRVVNEIYIKATETEIENAQMDQHSISIAPPPERSIVNVQLDKTRAKVLRDIGLKAIANGNVGVLLMAGGQGTRLGSSAPKGCYDIGLPSRKSLFQLQAERIRSLQTLADSTSGQPSGSAVIPWYIMTSGPTRGATEDFFSGHNFFGLQPENVIFFEQGTLPCLTPDGKIMLETPSSVTSAPDGNGGLYAALRRPIRKGMTQTVISSLRERNIRYLHTYGVDNCLVKVGDPVFLGACIEQGTHAGVKVVTKTDPRESVGVVAVREGKFSVIEYSEIPASLASARDELTGELRFRTANIANHFYTTEFLAQEVTAFESKMAYHIARKKIPTVDLQTGKQIKPSTVNGMKLELFIFDVFPFLDTLTVHEVAREDEFSPLKNAPGTGIDDPSTSRRDLLSQQTRWLSSAGAKIASPSDAVVEVEISPLVSYSGENLEFLRGKIFNQSHIVE